MAKRPEIILSPRDLHFIWIVDCSGSMLVKGKIQSLNQAIIESLPAMRDVADENPWSKVLIRAVKFSDGAQWHISQPTDVKDFRWVDLEAGGVTDMGKAMLLVADAMKISAMGERALPPVLVLLSDGGATDEYANGLKKLMDEPWGKRAVRIAIAIGQDADIDALQKFIGHSELKPLQANDAPMLVKSIRWASTAVLKAASQPVSQMAGATAQGNTNVPIPTAPTGNPSSATDVW